MATINSRRSFRIRPAHKPAAVALLLALFAYSSAALADDPRPLSYEHALTNGQPILMDVTDDIKADVHVVAWNRHSVEITVAPYGHYADSIRLAGAIENGTLAMHVVCSPSPHKGFFGWLTFFRPDARIDLHVPSEATLSVHVINGPVVVDNVTGQLRVSVVNGPITVTGAGSELYLTTTNGPVDADVVRITAQPDIKISTTNGPIDVLVPKGFKASVHASTVFGPVENNLGDSGGPGSVSLETVNGPVTISPH
jgi:hypothetical protein